MGAGGADLLVYGYALAALTHTGFAAYVLFRGKTLRATGGAVFFCMLGAVVATALWAAFSLLDGFSHSATPAYVAAALDVARYGLWFAFLLLLVRPQLAKGYERGQGWLPLVSAAAILAAASIVGWRMSVGMYLADGSTAALGTSLSLGILGLLLTEQLFRNLPEDSRWNAKPVCLGLACVFAFDVYLYSEALLFGRFDPDAQSIRGAVQALAIPLLLVALKRKGNWLRSLQVSRTAAFYSATLILAGAYMLFMAAIGYYVRFFGGEWGRALQLGLLFAGVIFLTLLVFSGSLRAWLKVFVGKHFFSYRYDYRQEWLRFTAMLSTKSSPQEVGGLVIRGLANMVECPGGSLWTRSGGESHFQQTARWNLPQLDELEPADSIFCGFLRDKGWVVDLDEYRSSPRRYGQLALPVWLLGNPNLWMVVPLIVGDELLGFVTLTRPRTPMELNWEVRDLLKTASRQAAGFMAQMQATEALLEARKFEAFNRMSAFVVHDLKNIVTQLSLMLKNAERLHDNREFQQDMLLTVESSLEKMKRLMLQLREGATPPGGTRGVELPPIIKKLETAAVARGRTLDVDVREKLATRGHDDRLERVLGHLVQNAFDATPPDGRVWLKLDRFGGQVKVEIGDTGAGMSEAFVKTKLFRPFNTTKHNGMGIGTYESAQYIRELGGAISVDSKPGVGTVVSVVLPIFEAQQGSDLHMPNAS